MTLPHGLTPSCISDEQLLVGNVPDMPSWVSPVGVKASITKKYRSYAPIRCFKILSTLTK